jgi:hypothetical protein
VLRAWEGINVRTISECKVRYTIIIPAMPEGRHHPSELNVLPSMEPGSLSVRFRESRPTLSNGIRRLHRIPARIRVSSRHAVFAQNIRTLIVSPVSIALPNCVSQGKREAWNRRRVAVPLQLSTRQVPRDLGNRCLLCEDPASNTPTEGANAGWEGVWHSANAPWDSTPLKLWAANQMPWLEA